ncbi:MAG: transporter [Ferruginibacter sp.]
MKKLITLLIITSMLISKTKACDICGCGVGSYYIGILSDFSKKIMGLRYRYNSLRTHIGAGGMQTYLTSSEHYNTLELWGGWNIGKRFRIMATIPYGFNERINQGITKEKNGLGDISVSGFYQLINSKKTINKKLLVQSLFIGGGIKLPTGKYNAADKANTSENANLFQLGTASVDYTLNAMYDVRLQDIGLNINASYKMNTANKYDYNYGNKLSVGTQLYYKYRIKNKLLLAPNAGLLFENAAKDIDRKFDVDISGGRILCGSIGLETGFRKIAIGANWQTPLSQNLANGFVKAGNRCMLHVSFSF